MKYHFIVDACSPNWITELQELKKFQEVFLHDLEEGETVLLCQDRRQPMLEAYGITRKRILLEAGMYSSEVILPELCHWMNQEDLYLFGSGTRETELAVRAAVRKEGSSVTGIHGCIADDKGLIVQKMVYSNHMEGSFLLKKPPYCVSLAKGLERAELPAGRSEIIREIVIPREADCIISGNLEAEEAKESLAEAKIVLVAGRGAKKKEGVTALEKTAKLLCGKLGVSRPAAMNAWAPMERLIGVSGSVIHPQICIAAGVSGAAAFLAGIEKSQFIVAVNTDEKAPIMKHADVVIVDQMEPVMEALYKRLEQEMAGVIG